MWTLFLSFAGTISFSNKGIIFVKRQHFSIRSLFLMTTDCVHGLFASTDPLLKRPNGYHLSSGNIQLIHIWTETAEIWGRKRSWCKWFMKISSALDNYFIKDQIFLIALEWWVDIFRVWESLMELQWNNAYGICKVLLLSAYRLDVLLQRYWNLLTTVIVSIMLILMMVRAWLDTFSTSVKVQLLGVHKSKRHLCYHRVRQVGTESARQVIWLQDLLSEVTGISCEKAVIRIAWTKNPVFPGRSKHIHKRYHFIWECVEKRLVEVEHVPGNEQTTYILIKALGRIKFKDMRSFNGIQELEKFDFKFKWENVDLSLKKAWVTSYSNPTEFIFINIFFCITFT